LFSPSAIAAPGSAAMVNSMSRTDGGFCPGPTVCPDR
jgi:hypothetical protein